MQENEIKEQEGKILTTYEHIFMNPDMYLGSLSVESHQVLIDGQFTERQYIPGLVKIIDEILDNSIDEAIRTNFKFANKIDVVIDQEQNLVRIKDNGRGLPQYEVETPEGDKIPYPLAAFTRAMAGGNFTKDRKGIGKNGVGSVLSNLYSTMFRATTCDGKNTVEIYCTQNAENQSYSTKKGGEQGTTVEFIPDLMGQFGIFGGIDDAILDVMQSRLTVLSVLFPEIKFTFNKKKFDSKLKKFAERFGEYVLHESDNSMFFISNSDEYNQLSFVNGVHTKQGGNHVNYLIDGLTDELIPMIKRKYKVEINKARVKENIFVFMSLRNFVGAKFDGQTKERLSNANGQIKEHCGIDFKAIARKMVSTDGVITPIIESAVAKKNAIDKAAATRAQKKALAEHVKKHVEANKYGQKGFETTLFLAEGDSAIGPFSLNRDKDTQGGFPLRGKSLNVWKSDKSKVLKNKEIMNLISILGMTLDDTKELESGNFYVYDDLIYAENDEIFVDGKWVQATDFVKESKYDLVSETLDKEQTEKYNSQSNVRRNTKANYDRVAVLTDADPDGRGHITLLLIGIFLKYWPHYIKQGRLLICKSPEYISRNGKTEVWSYNTSEFNSQTFKGNGWVHEHIKGLGQLESKDYKKVIREPVFDVVTIDETAYEYIDLFLGKHGSDDRKDWMADESDE